MDTPYPVPLAAEEAAKALVHARPVPARAFGPGAGTAVPVLQEPVKRCPPQEAAPRPEVQEVLKFSLGKFCSKCKLV